MEHPIPDANLFMMCGRLNPAAMRGMPPGYFVRACRPGEVEWWMAAHFDEAAESRENRAYIARWIAEVYGGETAFLRTCLVACGPDDRPVGTCFAWRVYGRVTTVHWFKVLKPYEGMGIGRGLLSRVLREVPAEGYPVFLHTQPSSYRAVGLYSDFGFALLTDPLIGHRRNDFIMCMPVLQAHMRPDAFDGLRFAKAPAHFLEAVRAPGMNQF
ncbi:MAG TPA: GNAT family N-acetyltransferase [Candidatus Limnocylindria bacterium]|nr:GNAT family N-acetyltransferase [Candidatus Limnocylindria bacterium]